MGPSALFVIRLIRVLFIVVLSTALGSAAKEPLDKRYQEFLTGPTSYLLTKTERETFQNLKTADERDSFIERFWEIRNPHPGTGTNEFKDEFYRRLAYVNSFYGRDAGSDGWRTDRGRTYLLFGRPQTTMNWSGNQELYPTELWFYSNPGLSELPAFFYILFFDRDGIGGYRFYHPYIDGPDKLMRSGNGGGSKAAAYNYIKNISVELAYATLSFIPGEPVDTDTYSGSMASADIIRGVQSYNQMPSYVSAMQQRAVRLTRVTSRVEYDLARTNLLAFLVWDQGQPCLHWQMMVQDPKRPKAVGGRIHFRMRAQLFAGDKLVVERTDDPNFGVPPGSEDAFTHRPFEYEDRLPVVEGKFRLVVTAENVAAKKTYEAEREVLVPPAGSRALLSDILVISRFEADRRVRPFQFGGVKFFPSSTSVTTASAGLRICYQMTLPAPLPESADVEYVVGGVVNKVRKSFEEKIDLKAADAHGSLVTSKTLPLEEFSPGPYQVVVRIKDSRTGRITAASAPFTIVAGNDEPKPVVISQGRAETPQWTAANEYERALCWLSQGRKQEAVTALEASYRLSRNPAVGGLLQKLQDPSRANEPGGQKSTEGNKNQ